MGAPDVRGCTQGSCWQARQLRSRSVGPWGASKLSPHASYAAAQPVPPSSKQPFPHLSMHTPRLRPTATNAPARHCGEEGSVPQGPHLVRPAALARQPHQGVTVKVAKPPQHVAQRSARHPGGAWRGQRAAGVECRRAASSGGRAWWRSLPRGRACRVRGWVEGATLACLHPGLCATCRRPPPHHSHPPTPSFTHPHIHTTTAAACPLPNPIPGGRCGEAILPKVSSNRELNSSAF